MNKRAGLSGLFYVHIFFSLKILAAFFDIRGAMIFGFSYTKNKLIILSK